ncbi:MAG: hypothetical protein NUV65_02965 [Candidatus Roizmanbacteria bacterium]|nr:hypothetical protein [Candidatus Roizmanbacteria bacterium]
MNYKKYTLASLHIALSLLLGYILGAIKLYEALVQPTYTYVLLSFVALAVWYCILFINFLFSFANQKKIILIYAFSSVSFGILYFVNNANILLSIVTIGLYFTFLIVTQHLAMRREKLYVRFSVHSIFFPIVKQGMFFLLILFAIMGYTQAKTIHQSSASGTEALLKMFAPSVSYALNRQINTQIASQQTEKIQKLAGFSSKQMVTKSMLAQTVEFLDPTWTKKYIGVEPQDIPIDKAIVHADGTVDLEPVVLATLPKSAQYIDQKLARYLVYIPIILAVLVLLILQPFFYMASFLFSLTAPGFLFILFKTGFLVKETVTIEKEVVRL